MKNLETFLKQLDTLGLNPDDYCIVSSGSLAVRDIRDCSDLDIVCTDKLWFESEQKFPNQKRIISGLCEVITPIENIDFFMFYSQDLKYPRDIQIETADVIDGKRYHNLEVIKYFKKLQSRDKDLIDLELIKQYENQL